MTTRPLLIIKAGPTFPWLAEREGDFDRWIADHLTVKEGDWLTLDLEGWSIDQPPPPCQAAVISGAHGMVTDDNPRYRWLEEQIRQWVSAGIPLLGICFGHQLLATAFGGRVDYNPKGREIGTRTVRRNVTAHSDPLFAHLPTTFPAHTTHRQSVLALPPGAVALAANDHDPHHAFRLGPSAWGVQFHPEFDETIMAAYITGQRADLDHDNIDSERLLTEVVATPDATSLLRHFMDQIAPIHSPKQE